MRVIRISNDFVWWLLREERHKDNTERTNADSEEPAIVINGSPYKCRCTTPTLHSHPPMVTRSYGFTHTVRIWLLIVLQNFSYENISYGDKYMTIYATVARFIKEMWGQLVPFIRNMSILPNYLSLKASGGFRQLTVRLICRLFSQLLNYSFTL